MVMQEIYEVNQ